MSRVLSNAHPEIRFHLVNGLLDCAEDQLAVTWSAKVTISNCGSEETDEQVFERSWESIQEWVICALDSGGKITQTKPPPIMLWLEALFTGGVSSEASGVTMTNNVIYWLSGKILKEGGSWFGKWKERRWVKNQSGKWGSRDRESATTFSACKMLQIDAHVIFYHKCG